MEVVTFNNAPGVSASELKPLILVLHGFPGIRSRQNREIAESIAFKTGADVRLVLYTGLGHAPGTFSFGQCLNEIREWTAECLEADPRRKIDFVGHSWGGFLSLFLANEFSPRVRRLALMSPLLEFFDETTMVAGLKEYAIQYPYLNMGEPEKLANDFVQVGKSHPTDRLIAGVPESTDVLFLQAKMDEITPRSVAEAKLPLFRCSLEYRIAENDHSFLSNRPQLANEIAAFLMG